MKVTLKNPWYSAGRKFGWGESEGFGVSIHLVKRCQLKGEQVYIDVKDGLYKISPEKALAVTKYYRSYFNAKGKKLIVIPRDVCEKI